MSLMDYHGCHCRDVFTTQYARDLVSDMFTLGLELVDVSWTLNRLQDVYSCGGGGFSKECRPVSNSPTRSSNMSKTLSRGSTASSSMIDGVVIIMTCNASDLIYVAHDRAYKGMY